MELGKILNKVCYDEKCTLECDMKTERQFCVIGDELLATEYEVFWENEQNYVQPCCYWRTPNLSPSNTPTHRHVGGQSQGKLMG